MSILELLQKFSRLKKESQISVESEFSADYQQYLNIADELEKMASDEFEVSDTEGSADFDDILMKYTDRE